MTADVLAPLRRYADAVPAPFPGFFAQVMSGAIGPINFIVTVDFDGQIEASLSRPGPSGRKPVSDAQAKRFFTVWPVAPIEETRTRHISHFVIQAGRKS